MVMPFTQNLPSTLNLPAFAPAFNWNFANSRQLPAAIDFSRNSIVATHFNEVGLLVLDAANVPRFNHVAGVCRGLLIESPDINSITYSEQLSNAAWAKSRSTVTPDVATSPSGVMTMDKLVEDLTASNSHYIASASATLTDATEYEQYIFAKAGEVTRFELLANFGSTIYAKGFDLTTATMFTRTHGGTTPASSASIEYIRDGIYKCSIRQTMAGTTAWIRMVLNNGTTVIYTGNGVNGCYFGGAQAARPLSSYIPTTTAAVTRALDLATVSTTKFATLYRQDAYSVSCEFYGQAVGTCTIFDLHEGTANNRIYLESASGALTFNVVTGGVAQCAIALGSVVTGTLYKVAAAWTLNDVAVSVDGATVVTDTSVTLPTVTQASVGCNYAGANQMNAELARLAGYAARLPNNELQGLTA